jgi:hypothetical protein
MSCPPTTVLAFVLVLGTFTEGSSVQLRNTMRVNEDQATRHYPSCCPLLLPSLPPPSPAWQAPSLDQPKFSCATQFSLIPLPPPLPSPLSPSFLAAGTFTEGSSVQLRNTMRVSEDEATRKAAYEGLRSVGPFVSESFLGIVRDRNKLAKLMGFQDFYDMKVRLGPRFGLRLLILCLVWMLFCGA